MDDRGAFLWWSSPVGVRPRRQDLRNRRRLLDEALGCEAACCAAFDGVRRASDRGRRRALYAVRGRDSLLFAYARQHERISFQSRNSRQRRTDRLANASRQSWHADRVGPGTDGKPVNWCCSGTRLTSDLFITNWHCGAAERMPDDSFWQGDVCASTIIDMSWDGDNQGREFACRKVEFSDKNLDVAIIRLSSLADGPALSEPLVRPKLSWEHPSNGNSIAVLHHPACQAKSITRGCSILNSQVAVWTGPRTGIQRPSSHTTARPKRGAQVARCIPAREISWGFITWASAPRVWSQGTLA